MWRANPPIHSARAVGEACAQGIKKDENLASRIKQSLYELERNSLLFQQAAREYKLHDLKSEQFRIQKLNDEEMLDLYSDKLGKTSSKATAFIRNSLLKSSLYERCCYCQHAEAVTLDHFVPKSYIPSLAIEPWNLVPACFQCNLALNQSFSSDAAGQMAYPYMLPEEGRWLYAKASWEEGLVIEFFAEPSGNFSPILRDQIIVGFNALKLRSRFAKLVAPTLVTTQSALCRNFRGSSSEEVKEHLLEIAADAFRAYCGSRHTDGCLCGKTSNSRKGALLEALAESDRYCAGAFAEE